MRELDLKPKLLTTDNGAFPTTIRLLGETIYVVESRLLCIPGKVTLSACYPVRVRYTIFAYKHELFKLSLYERMVII